MRLDRLLIEVGARAVPAIKTVTPYRPQMTVLGGLHLDQPAQSLQAAFEHRRVGRGVPAPDESVSQPGIVIGQFFFKPGPVWFRGQVEKFHQLQRERFTGLAGCPIAAEALEVLMDTKQREGPCSG